MSDDGGNRGGGRIPGGLVAWAVGFVAVILLIGTVWWTISGTRDTYRYTTAHAQAPASSVH
ncbi:MAG TPA: hypothetical protein VKY24_05755 [Reyranella sp.]|nr:hypothetical protein [Reyranella sp.]